MAVVAARGSTPSSPLRILTAVPLCDGHDSAIVTINLALARAITRAEQNPHRPSPLAPRPRRAGHRPLVVGVAGPGGAGKSTLIDELTARFLSTRRTGRIAILANDPSHPGSGGAVLGD